MRYVIGWLFRYYTRTLQKNSRQCPVLSKVSKGPTIFENSPPPKTDGFSLMITHSRFDNRSSIGICSRKFTRFQRAFTSTVSESTIYRFRHSSLLADSKRLHAGCKLCFRSSRTRRIICQREKNSRYSTTMAVKPAIVKLEHHEQQELCQTRAPYRQGRKLTAVKVYTVNDESQHLMICGVPQLQLREEIKRILLPYGSIKKVQLVPDYPTEEFTDVFHVHYERIQSARIAKRFVDGKNFYGGLLHVFYAPELESITETRNKLIQRRKDIAIRIKRHNEDPTNLETDKFEPREQFHRKKKFPTLPLTEQRLAQHYPSESLTTIYDGIPRDIDPRPVPEPSLPANWSRENQQETSCQSTSDLLQVPYNKTDDLGRVVTSMGERKRKNYRGRPVNEGVKVRVIRPQIVDTTKLEKFSNQREKKVFPVVKKVDSGITIKVLPKRDEVKKRIVLKDPSVSRLVQPSDDLRASIKMVKSNIRDAMKNS